MGRKSIRNEVKKIAKKEQKMAIVDSNKFDSISKTLEMTIKENKKKFKFPAARIKKIMQNDDGIGKISTYAPIVLGKATELFLVEFINEAFNNSDNSRKLEALDFENVIKKDPKFAFLENYEKREQK